MGALFFDPFDTAHPGSSLFRCVQCGATHHMAQHRLLDPDRSDLRSDRCLSCDPDPRRTAAGRRGSEPGADLRPVEASHAGTDATAGTSARSVAVPAQVIRGVNPDGHRFWVFGLRDADTGAGVLYGSASCDRARHWHARARSVGVSAGQGLKGVTEVYGPWPLSRMRDEMAERGYGVVEVLCMSPVGLDLLDAVAAKRGGQRP